MIIENGNVFCPDGHFHRQHIYIDDSTNTIVEPFSPAADEEVLDAGGAAVIPGLVDVHTHGAVGADFCDADAEALGRFAAYECSVGVTSFCPTSMTYPEDFLARVFRTAGEVPDDSGHAFIAGINVEGPFISPKKVGAQNPKYVQKPDAEMFRRLAGEAAVPLKLITIAPEEEGAIEFIDELKDEVHCSIGHTAADYDQAIEGFRHGADHITHLYNGGMGAYRHRQPGVAGAAFDVAAGFIDGCREIYVEMIADGIHSHPTAIRSAFALMGPEHMVLISDSMRATGMPDGESELGGQKVFKNGSEARLENGTLAGSVSNLMDCMHTAIRCGIPAEHAIRACTLNPARSIGMDDKIGAIRHGVRADLLILDSDWALKAIIKNGVKTEV